VSAIQGEVEKREGSVTSIKK